MGKPSKDYSIQPTEGRTASPRVQPRPKAEFLLPPSPGRSSALFSGECSSMCGIAGLYSFRSGRPVEQGELAAMAAAIAPRGPDDDGFFVEGPLGLAHRRLTILDTSRRGRQPMATPDGAATIV